MLYCNKIKNRCYRTYVRSGRRDLLVVFADYAQGNAFGVLIKIVTAIVLQHVYAYHAEICKSSLKCLHLAQIEMNRERMFDN